MNLPALASASASASTTGSDAHRLLYRTVVIVAVALLLPAPTFAFSVLPRPAGVSIPFSSSSSINKSRSHLGQRSNPSSSSSPRRQWKTSSLNAVESSDVSLNSTSTSTSTSTSGKTNPTDVDVDVTVLLESIKDEKKELDKQYNNNASIIANINANNNDSINANDLPWGTNQEWALKDNIKKYIVDIPQLKNENGGVTYAMWHALTRDALELAGYDIKFVQKMYAQILLNDSDSDNSQENPESSSTSSKSSSSFTMKDVPGSLPLLDEFEFQPNGGVSGKIKGLPGVADGTTVQTSSLVHVQLTVPRGYVLTEDSSSAYELGLPLSEERYSLDIAKMNIPNMENMDVDDVAKSLASGIKVSGRVASNVAVSTLKDKETTGMLINLGALTGVLLGGATAVNMLSHHLTVNVFWV